MRLATPAYEGGVPMMDADRFWTLPYPYGPELPPLTEDQVRRWEAQHDVRLPTTLGRALTVQNGGYVRGTDLLIYPLLLLPEGGGRIPGTDLSVFPDLRPGTCR